VEIFEVDLRAGRLSTPSLNFFNENFHLADCGGTVLGHDEPFDLQPEFRFGFPIEHLLSKPFQHHPNHDPGPALPDQRKSAIKIKKDSSEWPSSNG
jgi:hypothetical protein